MQIPEAVILPLKTDVSGVIRVSGTRVTLHTLLSYYKNGESPEDLHDGFPTVPLSDIYAVIAYYLANRPAVDTYLKQLDDEAEQSRQQVEANYTDAQKAHTTYLRRLVDKTA